MKTRSLIDLLLETLSCEILIRDRLFHRLLRNINDYFREEKRMLTARGVFPENISSSSVSHHLRQ